MTDTQTPPVKYAQQSLFAYGWDYVGTDDNDKRVLFESEKEALDDLDDAMAGLAKLGYKREDWRVVPYVAADDDEEHRP